MVVIAIAGAVMTTALDWPERRLLPWNFTLRCRQTLPRALMNWADKKVNLYYL
jgi:hypothetical protein